MKLERLEPDAVDWDRLDGFADRVVFQTREWLDFVSRTQGAEPVVAAVLDGRKTVGYFTGLVAKRYGIRLLGSPFPGWATGSMGFNLEPEVNRREAVGALVDFAFGPLGCLHLELKDRALRPGDLDGLGFDMTPKVTFEIDMSADEDTVFNRMKSSCRRAIRKSVKEGVVVEEASGVDFADEYYAQLEEVFAKQSLRPTYDVELVRELIRALDPTGRLLLVRAVAPDGQPLATGITLALNGVAYMWGAASWRSGQILRPNEAILWHELRYWKERGMTVFDLGGGGEYKRKYGPRELSVPFFRKSRFRALMLLREGAWHLAQARQRMRRGGISDESATEATDETAAVPDAGSR
jgi:CelD/BcsL family acetyltransferase involved in cellulose biosynthesis